MFERHVADSLRGALVLRPGDRSAIDAGAGAGLPGIPVAIASPHVRVVLVEPRQARAAFLEIAVERLGLGNVTVIADRVESVSEAADVVFSRAFVPLGDAWRRLQHLVGNGGRLVFFAGASSAADDATVPDGASSVETLVTPVLATSGPLIIIAR
jgi:16S rRNA (guanine527-N7)-methyltransferase